MNSIRLLCHVINAVFFVLLFLLTKRNRQFNQSNFVFLIWAIAATFSVFYIMLPDSYEGQGYTKFYHVFVVIGLFLLFSWPLIFIKRASIENILVTNNKFLNSTCVFIAIVSILPFVEHTAHLFSGNTINEMGTYHDSTISMNSASHLSWLSSRLMEVVLYFKYITPVLFIYYINKKRQHANPIVVIGLIMSLLIDTIRNLTIGGRFYAMQDFSLYIFLYLYSKDIIEKKWERKLLKLFALLIIFIGLGIAWITLFRFTKASNEGFIESILRYGGEGFGNLYSDMMCVTNHTYGAHIFRRFFGVPSDMLGYITGVRMFVYYTFIGDFIADFDIMTTVIIFVVISLLIYLTIVKNQCKDWDSFVLLTLYASIICSGYMYTSFMNVYEGLIGAAAFVFVYRLFKYVG